MVSEDAWGLLARSLLDYVFNLRVIARGAESELRLGDYMGLQAVFKVRRRKEYMDPSLDRELRRTRTLKEAKVLGHAVEHGVPAPRLYAVFPTLGIIIMEYIRGTRLKEALERGLVDPCSVGRRAGRIVGMLHSIGISHGDPTTSNFIVERDERLRIIDFGLAEYTTDVEDLAVDLHLFRRASESSHARVAGTLYRCFLGGYLEETGEFGTRVIERAREIMLRGRYVEERRTVWRP